MDTNIEAGTITECVESVTPRELRLGDTVKLSLAGYATGTVFQITSDEVHIVRPYIHTNDFSYTGGVLWYTGVEIVKLWLGSASPVAVVERGRELR